MYVHIYNKTSINLHVILQINNAYYSNNFLAAVFYIIKYALICSIETGQDFYVLYTFKLCYFNY